jgi:anti-sigma B factor antagonist
MASTSADESLDKAAVVALVGEVDDGAVPDYLRDVDEALNRPSLQLLIVDLGRTEFLDSSGLGMLVEINSRARAQQVALQLRAVPVRVQQLLRRTGLIGLLPISD